MLEEFEKDYNDLSDMTKKYFNERYEMIKSVVVNNDNNFI